MTERRSAYSADAEIEFAVLAKRVWRFRWFIAAITALAPLAVFAIAWLQPRTYEATATVVILTRALAPTGAPDAPKAFGPLSKEGYLQEAQSDLVLDRLQRKLPGAGIPASLIDQRGALTASAHATEPRIRLTARFTDPSRAVAAANAWAAALMEVDTTSGADRKRAGIDPVVSTYAKIESMLVKAEGEMRAIQDRHLRARTPIDIVEGQKSVELASRVQRALAIEDDIADAKASIADAKERLAQLELEMADKPGFGGLAEKAAAERSALRGLDAREMVLHMQLEEVRKAVDMVRREVGAAKLELAKLAAEQAQDVESLNREAAHARAELRRFEDRYSDELAARDSPASYLRAGAAATLPSTPQRRSFTGALIAVPFALFASLGCAFAAAVVLETRNQAQQ